MLGENTSMATLPVVEFNRALDFYRGVLGLKVVLQDDLMKVATLETSEGSRVSFYQTSPTKAEHTALTFSVKDIAAEIDWLRRKGVTLDDVDLGPIKTVDGVATAPDGTQAAWFKDTEGNTVAVIQPAE